MEIFPTGKICFRNATSIMHVSSTLKFTPFLRASGLVCSSFVEIVETQHPPVVRNVSNLQLISELMCSGHLDSIGGQILDSYSIRPIDAY